MAWTKNLGRVKGDDGDVYLPDISIQNGYLHFGWVKKTAAQVQYEIEHGKDINIPVYVPTKVEDGNITFSLSQTVRNTAGVALTDKKFYIKGDKGDSGDVAFDIEHFQENSVYEISNPQPNTIYVKDKKAWFYDPGMNDFFLLEGFDLTQYYKKTETYSREEVDAKFNEVFSQMELAYMLLEIDESASSNQELGG